MSRRRLSVVGACGVLFGVVVPAVPAANSLTPTSAADTAATPTLWLYANTRFPSERELTAWQGSLDLIESLARAHWNVASNDIHRLEDASIDEFKTWLRGRPERKEGQPVVFYFGSHVARDGRVGFPDGRQMNAHEFVELVNGLAKDRNLVLLVDACYAAKLETAGRFAPRIYRVYAAAANERAIEGKGRFGSPAMREFFGDDRPRASLFALLLERAVRNTARSRNQPVTWNELTTQLKHERDELARVSHRTKIPQIVDRSCKPED